MYADKQRRHVLRTHIARERLQVVLALIIMPDESDAASSVGGDAASNASSDQGLCRFTLFKLKSSHCLHMKSTALVLPGEAGVPLAGDGDRTDLLINQASVQDAVFGVRISKCLAETPAGLLFPCFVISTRRCLI